MTFAMNGLTKIKILNTNLSIINNFIRLKTTTACQLVYKDFGDPVKVIELTKTEIKKPCGREVLIKMLAAPVNPADINIIQGKYPAKVTLPQVPGNEGVGEIIEIGEDVSDLDVGDRVIPLLSNQGTWCTHTIMHSDVLYKVPKDLGIVEAATLTVNPCTAYRMLEDFCDLHPGDTIIQNGANSAVGQNVIQICKERDIKTINIVRDRNDIEQLREFLKGLGATVVLTEQEVRTFKADKSGLKKPVLGFNCVGGKNALEMLRHLDYNGYMVTYGGMSREPVTIPTSALIFKNIQIVGFWMTRWSKDHHDAEARWRMLQELTQMMIDKKLTGPVHKFVKLENFKEALQNTVSVSGFAGKKYLLDFC
ncbi:enoyl-[acyl-carrier-protein] reductase, mitochondrial [Chrysoperla carnea]|uniref:enoyl-[acyl-carrier-protein] reductase, mitochondrial n=1 Tax=Chrysoperla carnea TaxID=189513 RepID=UPI001D0625AB|nr:enoyl-[acyl-carrier-protein] reductase, mitochondrial [Chrysoperla carnea]